ILDEEILKYAAIKDEDIWTQIVDYSEDYPQGKPSALGEVNYKQLKSGKITVKGKEVPTSSLSSYAKALEIAEELKKWIREKKFFLTEPVQMLPGADSGCAVRPLKERPVTEV
ncbi:MAG: homocysteine biosynthesis protein, partial [Candidatus Omnitrophica bacterium]|nr:homocysteine biosynthesis protein [Candidatus Omnitrophota bacterium]